MKKEIERTPCDHLEYWLEVIGETRKEERAKLREKIEEIINKWSKDGQSFTKGVLEELSDLLKELHE